MYIAKKERDNKYGEKVYYLYLATSKRMEGKVKNIQKYMLSLRHIDLVNEHEVDKRIDRITEKFNEDEIQVLLEKIAELQN